MSNFAVLCRLQSLCRRDRLPAAQRPLVVVQHTPMVSAAGLCASWPASRQPPLKRSPAATAYSVRLGRAVGPTSLLVSFLATCIVYFLLCKTFLQINKISSFHIVKVQANQYCLFAHCTVLRHWHQGRWAVACVIWPVFRQLISQRNDDYSTVHASSDRCKQRLQANTHGS